MLPWAALGDSAGVGAAPPPPPDQAGRPQLASPGQRRRAPPVYRAARKSGACAVWAEKRAPAAFPQPRAPSAKERRGGRGNGGRGGRPPARRAAACDGARGLGGGASAGSGGRRADPRVHAAAPRHPCKNCALGAGHDRRCRRVRNAAAAPTTAPGGAHCRFSGPAPLQAPPAGGRGRQAARAA